MSEPATVPSRGASRLRAAVIGCGRIGGMLEGPGVANHAAGYASCTRTELVAVSDVDLTRAQECRERWGARRAYADFERMLSEERPEIVSVCTPDVTHGPVLRRVIEEPGIRAVLVEKPLALSVEDAADMIRRCEAKGIVIAVNYSRRYTQAHAKVRALVHSGAVGTPRLVRGLYVNGTLHNGTHWFDAVRFLFGEVRSVRAVDRLADGGEDPTLDVDLKLDGDLAAQLRACGHGDFDVFEMDIVGSDGRMRLSNFGTELEHWAAEADPSSPYPYRKLVLRERMTDEMGDLLLHAIDDLVDALETGSPRCSGRDGLAALEIGVAALASAATGRPVQIARAAVV